MNIQPTLFKDFYKTGHAPQYPEGTQEVYSNMTGRGSRIPQIKATVAFGVQAFVKEFIIERYNRDFFQQPKQIVVPEYQELMDSCLGPGKVDAKLIGELHDLGYLPIEIRALPEGTVVPLRVPCFTIRNTNPKFYWLTNDLETMISAELWGPMTSATTALEYKKILSRFAKLTSDMPNFVWWQGHDFSMRGHRGVDAAIKSGAAHLLCFYGTDTIASIPYLKKYYAADPKLGPIGGSVPATEHAVMCMGGKESELQTYQRLITKVVPDGIISIVSDTWDYWKVITQVLPACREQIMARNGKVVIRPDSGNPVKIICGDPNAPEGTPEHKGTIRILWEQFGGRTNNLGYKQLDDHIGVIYGDSITEERCQTICQQLMNMGFASTNMVFGIGSFTYQYNTRDTFGFAIKATHGIINGENVSIFKDPKTDSGVKKSAKGYLRVNADLTLSEDVSFEESQTGMLERVFMDGKMYREENLETIRKRLEAYVQNEISNSGN
jgi:nicotinamide phosphoribosyltransferase